MISINSRSKFLNSSRNDSLQTWNNFIKADVRKHFQIQGGQVALRVQKHKYIHRLTVTAECTGCFKLHTNIQQYSYCFCSMCVLCTDIFCIFHFLLNPKLDNLHKMYYFQDYITIMQCDDATVYCWTIPSVSITIF